VTNPAANPIIVAGGVVLPDDAIPAPVLYLTRP
jgi:hypothetical protein